MAIFLNVPLIDYIYIFTPTNFQYYNGKDYHSSSYMWHHCCKSKLAHAGRTID